jgi:hypothetical protein
METGVAQLVVDRVPLEIKTNWPLGASSLVSINDNTELVMIGGWGGSFVGAEVYKYNYAQNSFQYLGNLQLPIQKPLLIPVVGIECL